MVDRIDRQMATALGRHDALPRSHPAYGSVAVDDLRARALDTWTPFNANPPALFDVTDRMVEGPFRDVPIRIYRPTKAAEGGPAIFYVHGGGWFSCSLVPAASSWAAYSADRTEAKSIARLAIIGASGRFSTNLTV